MSIYDVFQEMLVILFGMAVGYLAHRLGYLGGETDQKISKIILNITMPCLIVASVATGDELPGAAEILSVLKVAAVFYGMELLVSAVLPRLLGGTDKQKGVWRYTLVFPNMAFIGYPVAVALFGPEALFYAVILVLPFNLLAYSLGPLMLAGRAKFRWQQLTSPCIIASVIALVVALGHIRLPAIVGECAGFVGNLTTPLSLLVVGSLLAGLTVGKVFASLRLWVLTVVRLLALPALLWLLLGWMNVEPPMVAGIAVILMAMPTAVNGSMLSMEYGGDTECMAQITFLTTLVSIITIPVVSALL
ncbi:AEC family transporter [Oscillibacter sp.]|uniref:AEC family transporter n=1 Tax=Oscillibacter sp. TaxID=1945593 RepID=UPI001B6A4D95|nr:AEC family transporter [Oscillibacter sp.]MBP3508587.1 AEC family transporter [Oscillibacter sp.]